MTDVVHVDGLTIVETIEFAYGNRFSSQAVATDSVNLGGSLYHITQSSGMRSAVDVTSDVLSVAQVFMLSSAAIAETIADVRHALLLSSQVAAAGSVSAGAKVVMSFADAARATDRASAPLVINLNSVVEAETDASIRHAIALASNAVATASVQSTIIMQLAALVQVQSSVEERRSISLSSAAVATGELQEALRIVSLVVTSTGVAMSAVTSRRKVTIEEETNAAAAASVATSAIVNLSLRADIEAEDSVRMPSTALPALWFNTTTAAAATWDGMKFNSMLEVDGRVYGAGLDGVSEVVPQARDDGQKIDWHVYWDLMDFENPARKRLGSVYVVGVADKPFDVHVVARHRGVLGRYRYVTKLPKGDMATNYRATPGKGLDATFYRIGVGGAGFGEVRAVIIDTNATTRRI